MKLRTATLAFALLLFPFRPDAADAAAPSEWASSFHRQDSLEAVGRLDLARALADSVVDAARAAGDQPALLEALNRRAWDLANTGRMRDAEVDLKETLRLAPALRDTARWCAALRVLSFAYLDAGRIQEAAPHANRFFDLARAGGNPRRIAQARGCLAYLALLGGHHERARDLYSTCVREYPRLGMPRMMITQAHIGLARASAALGDVDAARSEYQAIVDEDPPGYGSLSAADALNNLGNIELEDGDPSAAVGYLQRALKVYERLGRVESWLGTRKNLARALTGLLRFEEAAAEARVVADSSRAHGLPGVEAGATEMLAEIQFARGRYEEAFESARRLLSWPGGLPMRLQVAAEFLQVEARRSQGRSEEALALLHGIERHTGGELENEDRRRLAQTGASLEHQLGRPRAALALLAPAAGRGARGELAWRAHYLRARCYASLGRDDSALAAVGAATAGWERWRGRATGAEWRESREDAARSLYDMLGRLLLAPPGRRPGPRAVRRAFDGLQVFKARTLEERMTGPGPAGAPRARATADWLQRRGLRPGELFLDFYSGHDSVFAFAVSRSALRVLSLRGAGSLADRARRARELFSAPGAGSPDLAACDAAAAALGGGILGDVADLVRGARRLIVSADGPLADLPFGALAPGGRALLEDHEITVVPTASVLRQIRSRAAPPPAGGLLALVASADAAGRRLTGAEREVSWLADHLARVTVREDAGRDQRGALLDELARCDAVHVAAHIELNPEAPWRSGILLRGTGTPREPDYLRASTLAGMRLRARLAVVSSCQSMGSAAGPGAGVIGFSTAFLSAGVPSLVCTLWPIDDDATAVFMQDFYSRLLRGGSPSDALRGAQLAARSRPATRHPFFWAGFVLVGDPESRPALRWKT